jgi:hypothetical protein
LEEKYSLKITCRPLQHKTRGLRLNILQIKVSWADKTSLQHRQPTKVGEVPVSDGTADVVDVVYVNMQLDLWGALGWVKQQGDNS